jgi:hypothetical protein
VKRDVSISTIMKTGPPDPAPLEARDVAIQLGLGLAGLQSRSQCATGLSRKVPCPSTSSYPPSTTGHRGILSANTPLANQP